MARPYRRKQIAPPQPVAKSPPHPADTPSTKPGAITIKKIPEEILARVATFMLLQDLVHTRQASRLLERTTFETFADKCFGEMGFGGCIRERLFLLLLRESKAIAGHVRKLSKTLSCGDLQGLRVPQWATSDVALRHFSDLVGMCDKLEVLRLETLSVGRSACQVVLPLARSLANTQLTRLVVQKSLIDSESLNQLLSATPTLTNLTLDGCVSVDGWVKSLTVIARSSSLKKVEFSYLFVRNDDVTVFSLCGESIDGVSLWDKTAGGTKRKVFRDTDGKFQQYVLRTCATSYFFGNLALKAGIRLALSQYMSEEELLRHGLNSVDSEGKLLKK